MMSSVMAKDGAMTQVSACQQAKNQELTAQENQGNSTQMIRYVLLGSTVTQKFKSV